MVKLAKDLRYKAIEQGVQQIINSEAIEATFP